MEAIKALLKQVTSYWAGKDKRFKRNAIIIASSVLAVVIILSIILNHVPYATLYTGLNAEDAAAVMQALDEQKESYKVQGDAILVPARDVDKLRMSLSTHVSADFNLEILKQGQGLGTTESQMEDYRKLQLEHDIARAIRTVEGVREARVFLTIPRESQYVLTSSNRDSTASLLLSLESDVELKPLQVRAIALFVQKAVPGLSLDNISIMDSAMQYLEIVEDPEDEPEKSVDQYSMQADVEARLRRQVMALLVPVFGMGRVEAQVNVVLNFDEKVTDSTKFEPVVNDRDGVITSYSKLREQIENGVEPGAEPGVDPNTGIDTYPVVEGTNGNYEKTEEKVNLEVNKINEHLHKQKGWIEKLTVAVVVDNTGMKADLTENVKSLVKNAVGADMENVSVEYMPMRGAQDITEALGAGKGAAAGLSPWLVAAVAGITVLAAVLLSYLYVKSRRKAESAAMQAAALAAQTEAQAEQEEEQQEQGLPDIGIVKDSSAKEQIGKLIELNPELVANLLRSWLADEQE